ncbi:MAG: AAA family ATPase [Proteobacteria bacterium]|nr:AAA family ATPase [Pseudomonadota bacterium]
MEPAKPLAADALYRRCDPDELSFETTAELEDLTEMLGQDRAVEAIRFGASADLDGFNLFVLGPSGTGKHSFIRQYLTTKAAAEPQGSDWCYVNNLDQPNAPKAIRLPAGKGCELRDDLARVLAEAHAAVPASFESEDYRTRRQAIEEEFREEQGGVLERIQGEARARGIALIRTPAGVAFAPVRDGEVLGADEFQKLPEEERKRIQGEIEELERRLQKAMRAMPRRVRRARERIQELDREFVMFAVGSLFDDVLRKYQEFSEVVEHLKRVQGDIIVNPELFVGAGEPQAQAGPEAQLPVRLPGETAAHRRYGVNVIVDNCQRDGAPVIFEDHPTYQNLVGQVEHVAHMGALLTDFSLIKAGALHRANDGYLVLDARKVLLNPFAWEGLKQALKSRRIRIESLGQAFSLVSTVSLEPEPIPLKVKVVLLGDRMLYYLLQAYDPEFAELFKVAADFDDQMARNAENQMRFAKLLGTLARRESLKPLDRAAVARVIEHSARLAGDSERLSARVRASVDLVREAHFWARNGGKEAIGAADIECAIEAQIRRASRVRERLREEVLRETLLIDTDGAKVGQINGLAVYQVGDYAFGRPSRITARLRLGTGRVLDIEREVELGGPIHSKGVMILSSFLASRYAADKPLSLSASLVFEQSYSGVEGDSASSAELYALISALAEAPIDQSFAVTGSVNQFGEVQAIGGVNEKIEGFFEICEARGLTGRQGALIPFANAKHLMLERKVVDAVKAGRFRVIPVKTIDQGIEVLTGIPAGERDANGAFPPGSLNQRVEARLVEFAEKRRAFGAAGRGENRP